MARWTEDDIPRQDGRVAVVTGANTGLGLETARALAKKGCEVVLACRTEAKALDALASIRADVPDARLRYAHLDLADLDSVRAFAAALPDRELDLLINNAGLMAPPLRHTAQGFELQLGTNHLGHFALTGLLLPRLLARPGSRVVVVASHAHRTGRMRWDDLHGREGYAPWAAYGQSKLANLLFCFELDRRLKAGGHGTVALAAHPGWSTTELLEKGAAQRGARLLTRLAGIAGPFLGQGPGPGAWPQLRAATDPGAKGGEYYGPGGMGELTGPPRVVQARPHAHRVEDQARLWEISVRETGVAYDALGPGTTNR